jgi:hypothetical protein
MARVAVAVSDLMLSSRVNESLKAAGHEPVRWSGSADDLPGEADLVVCDLDFVEPEAMRGVGVPVLGFYSHVDTDTRRRALDAGLDSVVPRSRMARELPALVERLV